MLGSSVLLKFYLPLFLDWNFIAFVKDSKFRINKTSLNLRVQKHCYFQNEVYCYYGSLISQMSIEFRYPISIYGYPTNTKTHLWSRCCSQYVISFSDMFVVYFLLKIWTFLSRNNYIEYIFVLLNFNMQITHASKHLVSRSQNNNQ